MPWCACAGPTGRPGVHHGPADGRRDRGLPDQKAEGSPSPVVALTGPAPVPVSHPASTSDLGVALTAPRQPAAPRGGPAGRARRQVSGPRCQGGVALTNLEDVGRASLGPSLAPRPLFLGPTPAIRHRPPSGRGVTLTWHPKIFLRRLRRQGDPREPGSPSPTARVLGRRRGLASGAAKRSAPRGARRELQQSGFPSGLPR